MIAGTDELGNEDGWLSESVDGCVFKSVTRPDDGVNLVADRWRRRDAVR